MSIERRTAGFLLVLGFGFLMVAAVLFGAGGPDGPALPEWQSGALGLGLVVTLFGLATLELTIRDAGERILGRLGTIAFLLGCISWIVADAFALCGPHGYSNSNGTTWCSPALPWRPTAGQFSAPKSSPAGSVGRLLGGVWSGLSSISAGL